MEKKKKLIILGVIILILTISGLTYAILTWTSSKINIGLTSGCFTIDYTKGQDISGNLKLLNINEQFDNDGNFVIEEGMGLSYANLGIKSSCTIEGYGSLYLNVTTLSDSFKEGGDSNGALGYALLRNTSNLSNDKLTIENLKGQSFEMIDAKPITNTGTIKLVTEQLSNTELNKYLIVIFVNRQSAGNSITSATFNGNISADVNQKENQIKIPYESYEGIAKNIKNLYVNSNKTTVTNNSINYLYDTTDSLMQDVDGNIRYYGASPNNYVYFNCSDYANQTSSTCELWRIIGVFNGKIKLIRNESIGSYSWDNKDTTTGSESDLGKNDWTDARVMKLLNPSYESETIGGSLYYYSQNGNCYSGKNNAVEVCDFTLTGLKNDVTRNLISEVVYNLGGYKGTILYPNQIYEYEIGYKFYDERPIVWIGKIALPYASDYVYSTDLDKCNKVISDYNDNTCFSNNWMGEIMAPNYGWLLNVPYDMSDEALKVYPAGNAYNGYGVYNKHGIIPTVFLSSTQDVVGGNGSESAPYQLKVN